LQIISEHIIDADPVPFEANVVGREKVKIVFQFHGLSFESTLLEWRVLKSTIKFNQVSAKSQVSGNISPKKVFNPKAQHGRAYGRRPQPKR
jgi:hypothetical protein